MISVALDLESFFFGLPVAPPNNNNNNNAAVANNDNNNNVNNNNNNAVNNNEGENEVQEIVQNQQLLNGEIAGPYRRPKAFRRRFVIFIFFFSFFFAFGFD